MCREFVKDVSFSVVIVLRIVGYFRYFHFWISLILLLALCFVYSHIWL